MTTYDPNSYKADDYTYKKTIVDLLRQLDEKNTEIEAILNSRSIRFVNKTKKVLPIKTAKKVLKKRVHFKKKQTETIPKTIHSLYNSHYEDNIDFSKSGYKPEVKALAFYLPQFHTFKENDKWWGKGFTEWTNTKKATPRFDGHYQPREPHDDIGYYFLDTPDTIKKQVKLAKEHGIYGFCFYHYWFSGKRLMEKPVDIFLKNKDIDFPFCLCWANENWTRTWDGLNNNVLIEQKYEDTDPENFIRDIKKYLLDPRYIRVNNKPIIMVYAPNSIPNFEIVVHRWREAAKSEGIGDILIWSKNTIMDKGFKNSEFVDAEFDFAPTGCSFDGSVIERSKDRSVFDYSSLVKTMQLQKPYSLHIAPKPFYYSCTLGWDNSARRTSGYCVLSNYDPRAFYDWMRIIINETKRRFAPEERFIFINAWNELAEGTYLEPDKKFGYTNINACSKAIYGLPYNSEDITILDKNSALCDNRKKIAIQIHAFYIDVLDNLLNELEKMPYSFDLFITTDSSIKKNCISSAIKSRDLKIKKLTIDVVENVGRDVYPFLKQMSKVYKKYDIVGHFHTKKTVKMLHGEQWREYLYWNLFGSQSNLERIFSLFNTDEKTGIVFPVCFYEVAADGMYLGQNANNVNEILEKVGLHRIDSDSSILFPAGTMFWANSKSIEELFKLNLTAEDFPDELGQLDGTIAHAIERLIGIIPEQKGYILRQIINKDYSDKR